MDHPIVTPAADGARRRLARPVQPKEPISEHMLLEIAERYNTPSASLLALHFLFILLIGYFGLFRINELLSATKRSGFMNMQVFVILPLWTA